MPIRNQRVVPAGLHRGSFLLSIVIGGAVGAILSWWHKFALHHFAFMSTSVPLDVAVMLAPIALVALWIQFLAFFTPRARTLVLCGVLGFAAVTPAFVTTECFSGFNGGLSGSKFARYGIMIAIGSPFLAAVGVCVGMIARWVAEALGGPVEQTGAQCWRCAYDLSGGPGGAVCPECGIDPAKAVPRWRPITALMRCLSRHARPIAAAAAIIALAATAWWLTVWMIPVYRFVSSSRIPSVAQPSIECISYTLDPQIPTFEQRCGVSVSLAIDGRPDRTIKVLYLPRAGPDTAAMIVEYAALTSLQSFGTRITYPSSMYPSIRAYLTPEQALTIIRDGVPQSLIDALIAASDAANAIPMTQVTANTDYHSPIVVDASPFFPGLTPYTGRTLTY